MPPSRGLSRISCTMIVAVLVAACNGHTIESHTAFAVSNSEVENEVLALDRAWGQAYVTGNIEFVDQLLSSDWRSWTDHDGSDKAVELAEFRAGHSRSLENIIDNARVRVYDNAAVVEARERVRFKDSSGEHWLTWHITDVFIRSGGSWHVVASHQSTLPNS
jgi:hypothetical protein